MPLDVEVKRRANRALRAAGREALGDLGMRPVSSSPRQWIADRDWWVINLEFQSSAGGTRSMLNVGVQHLWVDFPVRAFMFGGRVTGVYTQLEGSDEHVGREVRALALAGREEVVRWLDLLADTPTHLRWLSNQTDGPATASVPTATAGPAAILLGEAELARRILTARVRAMDPDVSREAAAAQECRTFLELVDDPAATQALLDRRVVVMRERLKLPPLSAS